MIYARSESNGSNHSDNSLPEPDSFEDAAYIRIERHIGELTLRRVGTDGSAVTLLRAIHLGDALGVLEEFPDEAVIFDCASLTFEPMELVSAMQTLKLRPRIGCLQHEKRRFQRYGNAVWVTSKEVLKSKGLPTNWTVGVWTVGDYVDLGILHQISAVLRFVFPGGRDAEVYLDEGTLKSVLPGSAADAESLLREIAQEIPVSAAFHSSCKEGSSSEKIESGVSRKECFMSSLNLKSLSEIEGFIVASLVDSESGMMLGAHGNGSDFGIDIEVASAGNAEFIKTKRKTMAAMGLKDAIEDILVSLGGQYHLFRPLSQNNAYFLYLALDRKRANLAMARHALKTFDATVKI